MKDEIKEILEYYKRTNKNHFGYEQDKIITYKEAHLLLDYITNLQEELEEEKRIEQASLNTINNLQERNEKAIKCIKDKYYKEEYERKGTFANKLMNILQGEDYNKSRKSIFR